MHSDIFGNPAIGSDDQTTRFFVCIFVVVFTDFPEFCSLCPFRPLDISSLVHLTLPDNLAIYKLCLVVQRKYTKNENRLRQNDTRVLAAYFRSTSRGISRDSYYPNKQLPET